MKADYKNWMPKGMVTGTGCGSGALTIACAKKNGIIRFGYFIGEEVRNGTF